MVSIKGICGNAGYTLQGKYGNAVIPSYGVGLLTPSHIIPNNNKVSDWARVHRLNVPIMFPLLGWG